MLIRALEEKCFRNSPVELAGNYSGRNEFLFKNIQNYWAITIIAINIFSMLPAKKTISYLFHVLGNWIQLIEIGLGTPCSKNFKKRDIPAF